MKQGDISGSGSDSTHQSAVKEEGALYRDSWIQLTLESQELQDTLH